ncbi:MAG: spermidine synthase [Nitrospinales bacterium]
MAKAQILAKKKTRFNHIYVLQHGDIREMWFKGGKEFFLQSRIDVTRPHSPIMIYSHLMMASLLIQPRPERVLVIGLGGALFPNFLTGLYPEIEIDIVEIDSRVTELAKKYFFFRETPRCRVYDQDGRLFVQKKIGRKAYDMVLLDAFKSGSVPFHLKTLQFYAEICRLLSPGGVVASNLYGKSNLLKPHDLRTFTGAFRQVYLFEDPERTATALVACNREEKMSSRDLMTAAENWTPPQACCLSMRDIAATYKEDDFAEQPGFVFEDDFTQTGFLKSIEENNLDTSRPRPYAIMNALPEEPK